MTHIDGAPTVWPCCDSWECVCGMPDEATTLPDVTDDWETP